MKKIVLLFLVISITSCKKNDIASELSCSSTPKFGETKEVRDILKKFKLTVPKGYIV